MDLDRRTFLAGMVGMAATPLVPQKPVIARTEQGLLRGKREGANNVFLGIPFAKPPIGPRRFLPPEPLASWAGVRDALKNAEPAMQGDHGSEDCLYLNVWSPTAPGPHPVLVWIHGGGNVGGGTQGQSGASFADDGIVVVTIAYRLGSFGFLELGELLGPSYEGSGDNGIRDQEAALRWVRQNIAAFGGDPDQVTIMGQSAGAKDVAALVAAPSAQGLFHRAYMLSGSGITVHPRADAQRVADQLLRVLDLRSGDAKRLLSLPSKAILEAQHRLEAEYPRAYPFRPMVGGRYLPERPVDLVRGKVPLLLGTCRDESVAFLNDADMGKPIRSKETCNVSTEAVVEMERRYARGLPQLTDLERRVRLVTAEEYWMPSVRFAEAHAARGGKTWMYRFDHLDHDVKQPKDAFVGHGADMAFVWNRHAGWNLHEAVRDFIRGKDPSWPEYGTFHRKVMLYGQNGRTEVADDPRGEERVLWNGIL